MFKKFFLLFTQLFFLVTFCFAQENFSDFSELEIEISKLENQLKNLSKENSLEVLKKKAKLEESANMFPEAEESYFKCAEIASTEEKFSLILSAVRCSLCYGNNEKADELLAKIASKARVNEYAPTFKLYAVWSWLAKCTTYEQNFEPLIILKSYLELEDMKEVFPQILFTLWYIEGNEVYKNRLIKEFPSSLESLIAKGEVELAPSPYWFFLCRKN